MGSGSTEFETADIFDPERLNKKTRIVGNDLQITNLQNTYPGQFAYCIVTGATFTQDESYVRNSDNDEWIAKDWVNEEYTAVNGRDNQLVLNGTNADRRHYSIFTLPADYKLYLITHLELIVTKATATTASMVMGVDLLDASPPVIENNPLMALTRMYDIEAGSGQITVKLPCVSLPIPAGSVIGAWMNATATGGANVIFRSGDIGAGNMRVETFTASPAMAFSASWNSGWDDAGIKIYARGFS